MRFLICWSCCGNNKFVVTFSNSNLWGRIDRGRFCAGPFFILEENEFDIFILIHFLYFYNDVTVWKHNIIFLIFFLFCLFFCCLFSDVHYGNKTAVLMADNDMWSAAEWWFPQNRNRNNKLTQKKRTIEILYRWSNFSKTILVVENGKSLEEGLNTKFLLKKKKTKIELNRSKHLILLNLLTKKPEPKKIKQHTKIHNNDVQ